MMTLDEFMDRTDNPQCRVMPDYTEIARWAAKVEGKRVNSVARGFWRNSVLIIFTDGTFACLDPEEIEALREAAQDGAA